MASIAAFLFFVAPLPTRGAIPGPIGYQGRLKNASDVAQTGTFSFTFRIYAASSGGVALWTETQPTVSVDQGAFAVQLGSVTPFPSTLDFNSQFYLTVEVNGDGEMSPRIPSNSVPSAYTTAGINSLSSAPTSPTGGRTYYNSVNGSLNYYDAVSGTWRNLSQTSSTLQNVTTNGATTTDQINAAGGLNVTGNIQNILHTGQTFSVVTSTNVGHGPKGIFVAGKYAFVALSGDNQLAIYDITSVNAGVAPSLVGSVGVGSSPSFVVVAGRYAYVTNQNSNTVSVVDVSRPASPVVVKTVTVGLAPKAIAVSGAIAVTANSGDNTASIIDIDSPTVAVVDATTTVGTSPVDVHIRERYAYVANHGNNTISIIDITDPKNPVTVTSAVGNGPNGIYVSGRYAYVSNDGNNTLSVVDISDASAPSVVSTASVGNGPADPVVSGRYAYVPNATDGTISILDVSNPTQTPVTIATVADGSSPTSVAVSGRTLVVSNTTANTLSFIDDKGIETNGLTAHAAELGSLQVRDDGFVDNNFDVGGGLTVGTGGVLTAGMLTGHTFDIGEMFEIDANGVLLFATQLAATPPPTATGDIKLYSTTDNGIPVMEIVDSTGLTQRLDRDVFFIALNQTGSTIAKGAAVYVNGSVGANATVGLSKADSTSTVPAMGLAAESISNGGFGRVVQFGLVQNLNTSAFTVGQSLWISPTVAGGITNVEPSAPFITQPIGTVLRSDTVSGTIQVFSRAPAGTGTGTRVNSWIIGDGTSGSKSAVFNGTSQGTLSWNPSATHTISIPNLDGLMVVSTGTMTLGSIPFVTTGGALGQSNANLFWDATNSRLGIGTNVPGAALAVVGTSALQGLTFTVATGTSVTSTNLFATNLTATNLSVTNPFSPTSITWTNATGTFTTTTNLAVTSYARLPSDTKVNNSAVCLLDGTNCPSGTTPNFQTVTNTGNTTTRDIQFNGGTSTGAFTVQNNLTVTGTTALQGLTFINGTGTWLDFTTTTANPAFTEGRLFYDDTQKALAYFGSATGDPIHIGQEVTALVRNLTGSTISRGQAVRVNGDDGAGVPTVALARADSSTTSHVSGLANEDISNGNTGYVLVSGDLHQMDTSAFSSGDVLYLSAATSGALTNVRPLTPNITLEVGVVTKSNPATGAILVHFITPKFGAIAAGGVTYGDTNNFITDDATNFFFDASTKRLGLGTSVPSSTLHVVGTSQVQAITFTVATGTSATTTNLFSTNLTVTNFSSTSATFIGATSTNFAVLTYARFPTDTKINSTAVCLSDGTNCPSGTTPNFQTVTNTGNTTTHDVQFNGGTSTGAFTVQNNLTVTGTTALQGLSFVNGTSTSWFGFATASGTQLLTRTMLIGTSTQDVSSNYLAQIEASSSQPTGLKIANFGSGTAADSLIRFFTEEGERGSVFATSKDFTTFANATSSFGIAAKGNARLRLSTNGGDMRLTTDPTNPNPDIIILGTGTSRGNVGIGTLTPTAKLSVNGGMTASDITITNSTTTNATTTVLAVTTSASSRRTRRRQIPRRRIFSRRTEHSRDCPPRTPRRRTFP